MTRGKRGTNRAANLADVTAAAAEAARRADLALRTARAEVAQLTAWKADVERDGLPALRAERQRTADLALELVTQADELHRQRRDQLDELARMFLEATVGDGWTVAAQRRLHALVSPDVYDELLGREPGTARRHRRAVTQMPPWVSRALQ